MSRLQISGTTDAGDMHTVLKPRKTILLSCELHPSRGLEANLTQHIMRKWPVPSQVNMTNTPLPMHFRR